MPVYTSSLEIDAGEYPARRPALNMDFAKAQSIGGNNLFSYNNIGGTGGFTLSYVNAARKVAFAPQGTPRITHDPITGECLGMLFTQGGENILVNSTSINSALNSNDNINFNSNTPDTPAPDGTYTAMKVDDGTATGTHNFSMNNGTSSAAYLTCSVWVKKGSAQTVRLHLAGGTNFSNSNPYIYFNMTTGLVTEQNTIHPQSYTVDPYPDGWWRISLTAQSSGATTARFYIMPGNNLQTYTGTNSYMYLWGPQFTRSWLQDYCPTSGATLNFGSDFLVTKNASQFYGVEGGTWIMEAYAPYNNITTGTNHHLISLSPSDRNQDKSYQVRFDGNTKLASWGSFSSVTDQWNINTSNNNPNYVRNQLYKIGIRVKQDDLAFYVNGLLVGADGGVNLRQDITDIAIGNTVNNSQGMEGIIRSVKYYREHFTNAQLAHATT